MGNLSIDVVRGSLVESIHHVAVAVVDQHGRLVAASRDPKLVTFWRSAAKPFQALPLVQDGAADRFGFGEPELALSCASHSSEPFHLALADQMLLKVGAAESDLACGPHPPLSADVAREVVRQGITLTPRWSNCSGKHAGMVALAKHHGWPVAGYQRRGHPVQERILGEVSRWASVAVDDVVLAVDGCTTICFGLPLEAMALSYARFATSAEPAAQRIWSAMTGRPDLVAGTKRLCTDLMRLWPGEVVAKLGADGVYSAAIRSLGLGVAIKVIDGDFPSVGVALIAVVRQLLDRAGWSGVDDKLATLAGYAPPLVSTRGEVIGQIRSSGSLAFL